jgi:acetyl esterase/lipase
MCPCVRWQTTVNASSFLSRTVWHLKINTRPAPEDAYAATKWVAEHGGDIGGDPQRIAVGGDGAGGNLAVVVTLMGRERGTPRPIFQLLIYPMPDASTMRPSWWAESNTPTVSRESKNEILSLYLPTTGSLRDPFVAPHSSYTRQRMPSRLQNLIGAQSLCSSTKPWVAVGI